MPIESPILAALLALPVAVLFFAARDWPVRSRAAARIAGVLLWLAAAGASVSWTSRPRIVVAIDVSPSTRGATFRETAALNERLRPLLAGQPFEVRFFADGWTTAPSPTVSMTKLPGVDADAVFLLTDGRLTTPPALPPTFLLRDPALDRPADTRVVSVRPEGDGRFVADLIAGRAGVEFRTSGEPANVTLPAGGRSIAFRSASDRVTVDTAGDDLWPENDRFSLRVTSDSAPPAAVGIAIDGATGLAALQLPTDAGEWINRPAVALATNAELSTAQQLALRVYVETFGGTLILIGRPGDAASALAAVAPVTSSPPVAPQNWHLLIDASGSMASPAGGSTRWRQATSAAERAIDRLGETDRVSLRKFAAVSEIIAPPSQPAEAIVALRGRAEDAPSGQTNLAGALRAIDGPGNVLVVTDADAALPDPAGLRDRLRDANVRLYVLATGGSASDALIDLCRQTGGDVLAEADASRWATALQSLVRQGQGGERVTGGGVLVPQSPVVEAFAFDGVEPAYARDNARLLATAAGRPAVAVTQRGAGQVVSITAGLSSADLGRLVRALATTPADPRFVVSWQDDAVIIDAAEPDGRAMNDLALTLNIAGQPAELFKQTAPGRYTTPLPRAGGAAAVSVDGRVIARRDLPENYPAEFDAVGNDLAAMKALAERTGGRVVEPGDNQAIDLPGRRRSWPLRTLLTVAGVVSLLFAVVTLRRRA